MPRRHVRGMRSAWFGRMLSIERPLPPLDDPATSGVEPEAETTRFTVSQRVARVGIATLVVVLGSALFASQIHAMLR
jgi:hypothetical protein